MDDTTIWREGEVDIATLNQREQNSLSSHLGIEVVAAGTDWVRARIYVFDKWQAGYLKAYFDTQPHVHADLVFVDLDLRFPSSKPGPKPKYLTQVQIDEKARQRQDRRNRNQNMHRAMTRLVGKA